MVKLYWCVVKTRFHGGGIVSRHTTKELAERAARKWRSKDCMCGCCGVVSDEQYRALPQAEDVNRYSDLAK